MGARVSLFGLVVAVAVLCLAGAAGHVVAVGDEKGLPTVAEAGPFSPSNARTSDGKLIPSAQFFPASRCAKCHADTHAAWAESLHRNAGREPFYKASVDLLQHARGGAPTQHCESCHAPVSVFSGALSEGGKESRAMDDEGVTCSVCHSVVEARVDGTGSYTIRRPALLEREDGTPVFGDLPDSAVMADIPGHKRAMMRPLLRTPEFCAACHKSVAPPALNNYKFLRGFSAYDEWQQSGASLEAATPYYRRERRADCRACHMPKVESAHDLAAKDGAISSHRWPGANTATALFYGQTKQVELTEEFLKENVLSVDIFALRDASNGRTYAPLDPGAENVVPLRAGEEVTAEVVVFNRKAAHSFPPELRDLYEPWVEFEAVDAAGRTIFHSGFVRPDQTLDETAHVYKSILLDDEARPLTRHQVWLGKIKAYDNFVPQGRGDVVRYRFRVPSGANSGAFTSVTLRARVNYRRFIQEYTDYVLRLYNARLAVPVVRMAEAEVRLVAGASAKKEEAGGPAPERQARRWNDYAIGLMEQAQYGAAADAFRRAGEFAPRDPDLLVSAAAAELKTERYGPERDQLRKAAALIEAALKLSPKLARARFYRALVLRGEGDACRAAAELAGVAAEYPRDREVQRQLGQTLYGLGRMAEARAAFEAVLRIDPNDAGAYQFLSPIYAGEGREAEAERARSLYLLWRDDPVADAVAVRYFTSHPEWADERVWSHAHGAGSPPRPTLTGGFAASDR